MDLSQIGNIHIFRLPIDTSLLAIIRQQLWASVDRIPDIHNLLAAVPCKRIDRQPFTYLSALPHQLLKGNTPSTPYSSTQILGNYLLENLAATSYDKPTTQWQGTANDQGYLYLQPSNEAITAWLNHLLSIKNSVTNSYFFPPETYSSTTLQYINIRCSQLLEFFPQTPLALPEITITCAAQTTTTVQQELIGAIADIWDHIAAFTPERHRRILSLSRQLVENFLEFEKNCCLGNKKNQITINLDYGLLAIVQITVKLILQTYWDLDPLSHW